MVVGALWLYSHELDSARSDLQDLLQQRVPPSLTVTQTQRFLASQPFRSYLHAYRFDPLDRVTPDVSSHYATEYPDDPHVRPHGFVLSIFTISNSGIRLSLTFYFDARGLLGTYSMDLYRPFL